MVLIRFKSGIMDPKNYWAFMRENLSSKLGTRPRDFKKLSAIIGCLQTRVCKQPIIALYLEFEYELKFYNLRVR